MVKKILLAIIVSLVILGIGIAVGYGMGFYYEHALLVKDLNAIHPIRNHTDSYQFISPLLTYAVPSAEQETDLVSLETNISNFIDTEKKNGDVSDASMYFYDLNKGRWIGVNETEKYNPASMLKVVIMVSYFKEAENNPDILNQNLTYISSIDQLVKQDPFNSLSNLQVNQTYTIESLIEKMITDSDNGAELLLLNNIDKNSLDAIYNALNIDNPDNTTGDFTISPRAYSLFFRILYSATYLDDDLSEKALSILSQTTFDDGIVAGLPINITVAHKYGEYVTNSNGQIQNIELHDCGIVYYPNNPYFLCIMTRGQNLESLKSVIKNISTLVYKTESATK